MIKNNKVEKFPFNMNMYIIAVYIFPAVRNMI